MMDRSLILPIIEGYDAIFLCSFAKKGEGDYPVSEYLWFYTGER